MNTVITFTLTQLVGLVLAICAIGSFNSETFEEFRRQRLDFSII